MVELGTGHRMYNELLFKNLLASKLSHISGMLKNH